MVTEGACCTIQGRLSRSICHLSLSLRDADRADSRTLTVDHHAHSDAFVIAAGLARASLAVEHLAVPALRARVAQVLCRHRKHRDRSTQSGYGARTVPSIHCGIDGNSQPSYGENSADVGLVLSLAELFLSERRTSL